MQCRMENGAAVCSGEGPQHARRERDDTSYKYFAAPSYLSSMYLMVSSMVSFVAAITASDVR